MTRLNNIFHFWCDKLEGPLVVSGYGLTEYQIFFCKKCGKIKWNLTKDVDDLYPRLKDKVF